MLRDSDNILERLRSIKIKRHKDIRRPTFREKPVFRSEVKFLII
jgi:hypothetical protein